MLRIYDDCLAVGRLLRPILPRLEAHDKDLARQLRRAAASMVLNVAEGSGGRGGTRRARYFDALGSARETLAALEFAAAIGYLDPMGDDLRAHFRAIVGTLVAVTR